MIETDLHTIYQKQPTDWFKDVLGTEAVEGYQARIADQVVKNDRIAIRACHSVGKTWLMSRICLWFLFNYDNCIVITTAPTHRQVEKLLWGELRDAYKNAKRPLGGRLLNMELKLTDKHYALGFSPKKEAASASSQQQGSSFQGFHSDHVMIVFDEATGVDPDIWVMAEGLLTSGKIVKFVAIANPTTRNSVFYNCFKSPNWVKERISCYDSPNLIANGLDSEKKLEEEIDYLHTLEEEERINRIQSYKKPVPYLLTAQFVVPYVMQRGLDHPLVLSKVMGDFPKNEDNVFIQLDDVEAAIKRTIEGTDKYYVGVDVARFGEDKSVITVLHGYKQIKVKALVKRDIPEVTGEVLNVLRDLGTKAEVVVCIDATGLGAGVFDLLKEKKREDVSLDNIQIEEIHNGASAVYEEKGDEAEELKARYANLKARQFDLLGQDVKARIELLPESIYSDELPTIRFSFDSKGRYVVESKKDYKARTGLASPDHADSLALANFGRYVNIKHGHFLSRPKATPLVKAKDRRKRSRSGIKVREY